jgi:hypothetical protein
LSYYKYKDEEDIRKASPCSTSDSARGCAQASSGKAVVYSWKAIHRHELNHAYLAHLGFPHLIYAEGLAMLLECDSNNRYPLAPSPDWKTALFQPVDGAFNSYRESALLVRWLWDQFGPRQILEAYARSEHDLDPEPFAAEFASFFGVSLTDAWAGAIAGSYPSGIVEICPCDGLAVATDGTKTNIDQCDIGDLRDLSVFEIAPGSTATIEATGYLPLTNSPRACPGTVSTSTLSVTTSEFDLSGVSVGPLDPGTYYLSWVKTLRLTTLPIQAVGDCAQAQPYSLLPDTFYSKIRFEPDARIRYVRLEIPTAQQISDVSGWPILVCSDCEAARTPFTSCTQLQADASSPEQVLKGELLLVIPGQPVTDRLPSVVTLQQDGRCYTMCPYDRTKCPAYCGTDW